MTTEKKTGATTKKKPGDDATKKGSGSGCGHC